MKIQSQNLKLEKTFSVFLVREKIKSNQTHKFLLDKRKTKNNYAVLQWIKRI